MGIMRIQHVVCDGEARFQVVRVKDAKTAAPVTIRPPVGFPVEGRPNSDLIRELRWYLEDFLGYPFAPETEHADRVLDALKQWGRQAFDALFDNRQASGFLRNAQDGRGYNRLHLQIASDDPRILAWPWEALRDPAACLLAQTCQIERRLKQVLETQPLDRRLPRDRVNILLVTARPHEGDVQYRSISRPLIELIDKRRLPAHVTMLRPPTFDQLRRHLYEHPHHYHILHFDGHGGYDEAEPGTGSSQMLRTPVGCLLFEDAEGKPDKISANQLSNLLRESPVPAVVLNACQSAMIDERAEDPFASVAVSFLRSGTRSVVAMAYSLYVSGAQQFLPAFYERLFKVGDVAQAVRAGRQQMYSRQGRVCARGRFPLHDWLVPVVYQQDPLDFSFAVEANKTATRRGSNLPPEARDTENPHGFIGRDGPLLALERAMLRPPAGILIAGLGGIGKTTLARGFVGWLAATDGLARGCLWLTFKDIRSAEFVVNRMGEALFGGQFAASGKMDARLDALARVLREDRVVVVWDNFESARGIAGTSVAANMTEADLAVLLRLLEKLRGGQTKVVITSRSREEWLGHENRYELAIGGLDGDERWEYCEAVLRDLGLKPKRDDPKMIELMDLLGGHPLAMRAILPKLKDHTPADLAAALRGNLASLDLPEDEVSAKLAATLRFVEESLAAEQRPLLIPLSMHEGFVDAEFLDRMAKRIEGGPSREVINCFTESLGVAGLLRRRTGQIFELHPALTGYLRAAVARTADTAVRDGWARAFVDVMGTFADALAPRELHEQRLAFQVHAANFNYALAEAERLRMDADFGALLESLAAYAELTRDFACAARLYMRLAEADGTAGDHEREAVAYHQLGLVAQEQRDFAAAERWCRKSLAIKERQGNELGAARTYYQLGRIAEEQRNFAAAERWYRKSLTIVEKQGDEHGAARTYHQLGMIAEEQWDFATAEQWYRKSLTIAEKQGDEHGAASTYHQLGRMAEEQRDFAAAERWHQKSLAIAEKQGDEHGAAITYHQLGRIAQEQRDFAAAEQWYLKSLVISEKLGDEHGAASTYHQLGRIAEEQRNFAAAEQWYRKSLTIAQRQGDEHGTAMTYHQLGMIAEEQRDFAVAERWYRKSLTIKEKQSDEHGAARTYHQLGMIAGEQRDFASAEQWYRQALGVFERLGDKSKAAITYHELGRIAEARREFAAAERWYRKSLTIAQRQGDEHGAAMTYHQLGRMAEEQRDFTAAQRWCRKAVTVFERLGDGHGAAMTYHQLGIVAQEQRRFAAAERWYQKSLAIKEKQGDEHGAASTYHQLGMIAQKRRKFAAAEQYYRKSLTIAEKQGDEYGAAMTHGQLGILAGLQGRFEESGRWLIKCIQAFARCNDPYVAQRSAENFLMFYEEAPEHMRAKLKAMWKKAGLRELPRDRRQTGSAAGPLTVARKRRCK